MCVLSLLVNNVLENKLEKTMEVHLNITLSEADVENGVTMAGAVAKLFPVQTPLAAVDSKPCDDPVTPEEVTHTEGAAPVEISLPQLDAEASTPDPEPTVPAASTAELDSSGVPWNSEIHSSNRKKYGDNSKEAGRWIWKKGTDPEQREDLAGRLRVQHAGTAQTIAPTLANVPRADNAGPSGSPPATVPTADNAAAPVAIPDAPAGGTMTWPGFLQALKANGMAAAQVTPLLAEAGAETIAQLANNDAARTHIAQRLGLSS